MNRRIVRLNPNPNLVIFITGLVLFSAGLALAWLPLGLIGPGAVLMAITLFGGGGK